MGREEEGGRKTKLREGDHSPKPIRQRSPILRALCGLKEYNTTRVSIPVYGFVHTTTTLDFELPEPEALYIVG